MTILAASRHLCGVLRYLYEHKHATPFEMAGMIIEVQAPIFVFREWHRHRTQSYNEMSARYVPLPDTNYIPTIERLMMNSQTNKQAGVIKGAEELNKAKCESYLVELKNEYESQEQLYQVALRMGIPKELARIHLPVGRYSRMRASANLRNWLAFLTLRMDQAAQWEIRQYANVVGSIIAKLFPRTWELFNGEK
jgi:thymidylate synthase (FAD)